MLELPLAAVVLVVTLSVLLDTAGVDGALAAEDVLAVVEEVLATVAAEEEPLPEVFFDGFGEEGGIPAATKCTNDIGGSFGGLGGVGPSDGGTSTVVASTIVVPADGNIHANCFGNGFVVVVAVLLEEVPTNLAVCS